MKLVTLSLSLFLPIIAYSNTVEENIKNAKYRYSSSQGQIDCSFPGLKPIKSTNNGKILSTRFKLKDFEFDIVYSKKYRSRPELIGVNRNISVKANKKRNFFYFQFDKITTAEKAIVNNYNLGNTETGYNNIICRTRFDQDKLIKLDAQKIHINMHPHSEYDFSRNTFSSAQGYIDNPNYNSVILLENPGRSRFYNQWNVEDIQVRPTVESRIYTAPAGNSLFSILSNDINVTYTGNYLNFGILNNTRSLIQSFVQQSDGGKLIINFDVNGLNAQPRSLRGNKAMNLRNFMHVGNLFNKHPKLAQKFRTGHSSYYFSHLNKTKKMFNTVKYTFKANGVNEVQSTIQGSGEQNYEIIINYINN